MVQFECPRHWNPSVSSNFGVERTTFSDNWPFGVIRMGSPKRNTARIKIKNTTPGIDLTPPQKTGFMGRGEIDSRSGILNFYSGVITD